jgi:hypothetical protein
MADAARKENQPLTVTQAAPNSLAEGTVNLTASPAVEYLADNGTTYVKRVLVPALDPGDRSS